MHREIVIIGAGGHGKVAVRAAQAAGMRVAAVYDDDPAKIGTPTCGVPVVGTIRELRAAPPGLPVHVALGDNRRRMEIARQLMSPLATIVHPAAVVDESVRLGLGCLVLAGAVIQVDATIGALAIINDNATVEHDARVGEGAHVAPGACLTGGVRVGTEVLVGAQAVVLPRLCVGEGATVGAGAVVTRDVPPGATVVGNPARVVRSGVGEAKTQAVAKPDAGRSQIYLSPPHMSLRERDLLLAALDSNWIAPLGPQVDAFEAEFAAKLGVAHAVALSSGTAALHLALLAAGVGAGDSVLCSTLTFAATANAIRYVGAEPVFIDSERASWNIDPELVEAELCDAAQRGRLPKAAVIVDVCGQCANWDPILAACRRWGVTTIADSAESLGATYRGQQAGTMADIGCYSFNGNKIITTSGGGMLATANRAWAERVRHLATQARDPAPHYQHSSVGYNYRLSNLLAAVGRGQLELLEDRVARRRANFAHYRDALADVPGIEFMPEADFGQATRWLTCLTLDERPLGVTSTEVCQKLAAEQIEARPMWKPLHQQPAFAGFRVRGGAVAEDIFRRALCLPSGSSLTAEDRERVIAALRTAVSRKTTSRAA
jgi:sugar O-acyltransferase (sialic acid O-acetyltransferase NeuD family)